MAKNALFSGSNSIQKVRFCAYHTRILHGNDIVDNLGNGVLGRGMIPAALWVIQNLEQIIHYLLQMAHGNLRVASLQTLVEYIGHQLHRSLLHFGFVIQHLRAPSAQQLRDVCVGQLKHRVYFMPKSALTASILRTLSSHSTSLSVNLFMNCIGVMVTPNLAANTKSSTLNGSPVEAAHQ